MCEHGLAAFLSFLQTFARYKKWQGLFHVGQHKNHHTPLTSPTTTIITATKESIDPSKKRTHTHTHAQTIMKFITSTTLVACTTLIMSLQQVVQAGTPVMWLNNYGTVVYNQNLANGCYDISGVSTAQGSFSGPSGFALYTGYGCTGNELVYSLGAANVGYISTNSWCHQAYSMKLF